MRHIPATMATQHPDNASAPFWDKSGNGFISTYRELDESLSCWRDLGVSEFMWDWEGKFSDEAVMDKMFSHYYEYFKKFMLGKDRFLTFRLPNIWKERGYSLIRALMVILTSEDFAKDLGLHTPPLFEVILPMTESADQMIYIQDVYKKLARFKGQTFNHQNHVNTDYLELIPLVESVEGQVHIRKLLTEYYEQQKRKFHNKLTYIRPFLARSDPALLSGMTATVLANKIAISEIYRFGREKKVEVFPIIGVGSLPFRGGLNPSRIDSFVKQYAGIRTVTVQSGFRYDYPLAQVKRAIARLGESLPRARPQEINPTDMEPLKRIIGRFTSAYERTLPKLLPDMEEIFAMVPKRRERRLHIGLLAYRRELKGKQLPRAINFTAGFYSIGIPPELLGFGRVWRKLSEKERKLTLAYYPRLPEDLKTAGKFLNHEVLARLCRQNSAWQQIAEDIQYTEDWLGPLGPKTILEIQHKNLSSNVYLLRNREEVSGLIQQTGVLRRSLG